MLVCSDWLLLSLVNCSEEGPCVTSVDGAENRVLTKLDNVVWMLSVKLLVLLSVLTSGSGDVVLESKPWPATSNVVVCWSSVEVSLDKLVSVAICSPSVAALVNWVVGLLACSNSLLGRDVVCPD